MGVQTPTSRSLMGADSDLSCPLQQSPLVGQHIQYFILFNYNNITMNETVVRQRDEIKWAWGFLFGLCFQMVRCFKLSLYFYLTSIFGPCLDSICLKFDFSGLDYSTQAVCSKRLKFSH